MEVNNVSGAYTTAGKVVETDDELEKEELQEETDEVAVAERDAKDTVELSQSDDDYDETTVLEKANAYLTNILADPRLTEKSFDILTQYKATFDVDKFIQFYGPFTTTAEISAALYAITSNMIKYQEEE